MGVVSMAYGGAEELQILSLMKHDMAGAGRIPIVGALFCPEGDYVFLFDPWAGRRMALCLHR